MATLKEAKALTVTFLTPVSIGSLNGSDKEADNVSSIKKLTRGTKTYPYVSSQALRRALRDQLGVLNHKLSEGQVAKEKKGAAITQCLPKEFIDDDLFGFMDATKGGTHKRTSPVRVAPLLALDPYEGDLDFGTNYMGHDAGGNPNIFETEIHGGLYRGTLLIELDAVGKSREGEGESASSKSAWELTAAARAERVARWRPVDGPAAPVVERAAVALSGGHQPQVHRRGHDHGQGADLPGERATYRRGH
jgi:CRISPR-associated protein Cst2